MPTEIYLKYSYLSYSEEEVYLTSVPLKVLTNPLLYSGVLVVNFTLN